MSTLQEASDLENNVTDAFVLVLKVSFFVSSAFWTPKATYPKIDITMF